MEDNTLLYQWGLVIISSLILIFISPLAKSFTDFYKGSRKEQKPNFYLLTSSLVISWLFAKSITNSANLGLDFGIVGGVAYACYYMSFITAGIVIYQLRKKGGFLSIHHFLKSKFGRGAIILFSVLICFRLFNEIWSNTIVIGSYFGEPGSMGYLWSIIIFTLMTLWYSLKGGMSSSIMTDVIQFIFFAVLLVVILSVILPKTDGGVEAILTSGEWGWSTGVNLIFVGLVQCISYPFHDPVMTDRGFISDIKTTLKSFLWAGVIGAISIILFSFVGIYGAQEGVSGQAPVEVSKLLGVSMTLLVNFIMITSAASTLDSSFSSFSKLTILDLKVVKKPTIKSGRLMMVLLTICGTIPVFLNPTVLSATTVSGTMVIGLAPIFMLWKMKAPKISFYASIIMGITWGFVLVFGWFPEELYFTSGKHAELLTVNVLGTLSCFIVFVTPALLTKNKAFMPQLEGI
ncbi:Na+/proline symporter [Nonlabens xylanidelens]|uniref:Na+/proline symporter n=1 Tax=Nonlabens xylanidelens TaxID=191564 RepID=A0A2S6IHL9_9FLAO|nr:sodium:solute symporter [Nonlabens xylanidelens]PPK93712.1 Na+/proline symporter [Nonlabens xylanidelens]PQJ17712.1 sodium:solute symporter [Nonlabens xylanidelens]